MEDTDDPFVQLATRIPKGLHHELKLHCVHGDTSVMEFVVAALKEKLASVRSGSSETPRIRTPASRTLHRPAKQRRAQAVRAGSRRKGRGTAARRLRRRGGLKRRTGLQPRRSARRKARAVNPRRRTKSSRSAIRQRRTRTARLRRRGKDPRRRRLIAPAGAEASQTLIVSSVPTEPTLPIAPESPPPNALQPFTDAPVVQAEANPAAQDDTPYETHSSAIEDEAAVVRLAEKERELIRVCDENVRLRDENTRLRACLAAYDHPTRDQTTEPTEAAADHVAQHWEAGVRNEPVPKPEPVTAEQSLNAVTATTPKKYEGGSSGQDG